MIVRILSLSFHELGLVDGHKTCKETSMHMFMEQASVNYTALVFICSRHGSYCVGYVYQLRAHRGFHYRREQKVISFGTARKPHT